MKSPALLVLLSASLIGGAFLAPAAVAQVGPGPIPPLFCAVNSILTPLVRAEGLSERIGDITMNCSGGTPTTQGTPLPTVNLTVVLNAPITSRTYPTGWSEVELIVDEPNSGLEGSSNTQLACADPNGACTITSKGTSVGTYDGTSGRPNVFLGQVSGNSVTFPNVPFDVPGAGGHLFRIANLRVNASTRRRDRVVPSFRWKQPSDSAAEFQSTCIIPRC